MKGKNFHHLENSDRRVYMKKIIFIFLLTIISVPSIGQFWEIRYRVVLGGTPPCGSDQISVGPVSSGYYFYINSSLVSTASSGTFYRNGSISVIAGGGISRQCCYDTSPPTGCTTESVSGNVNATSPSTGCPESFSDGRAEVRFLRLPITKPTLSFVAHPSGLSCNERITLTTDVGSSVNFQWQVTDDITNPGKWTDFGTNSYTVTVTIDDLYKPGFADKFGKRWVRLVDPNCRAVASPPSDEFRFHVSAPDFFPTESDLQCHNSNDGSILVNVLPASGVITDFVIKMYEDADGNEASQLGEYPVTGTLKNITTYPLNTNPGLPPGTYYLNVQNNTESSTYGACRSILKSVTIANPSSVATSFSSINHVSCNGGSNGQVTVSPTGGTGSYKDYSWSNGATTPNISSLTAGTYTVNFKDTNDCPASGSITLTEPTAITIDLSPAQPVTGYEVSCDGKNDGSITASASGGTPGYSYQWTGGPATATYSDLPAGTYTVNVTDGNSCPAQRTITLSAKPKVDFALTKVNNTCAGASDGSVSVDVVSITNNVGSSSYSWSVPGNTGASLDNIPRGTYTVTVTDGRGPLCSVSKSETLIDPPSYSVALSAPTPHNGKPISCNGEDDGELQAVVRDAANNLTTGQHYEWFRNGTPLTSGSALSTVTDLAEGNYKVVVTYNTSCKTEQTLFLNDPDPVAPAINITSDYNGLPIRCTGESNASLTASASGGTGPYTYTWNDINTTVAPTLTNIGAGTYQVTATDANSCQGTSSRTLTNPAPVTPSISIVSNFNGFAIRCAGEANGHLRASGTGGTGSYTYLWNTGSTGVDLTNSAANTYTLTATDQNGCSGTANLTVTQPTAVTAAIEVLSDFNGQAISCNGSSNGRLQANGAGGAGAFTYVWSTGATTAVLSTLAEGSYTVTATDANGCSTTANRSINDPDPVVAQITETSDFNGFGISCAGTSTGYLKASGSGGTGTLSYQWLTTTEISNTLSNVPAGTYTVRIQDANGCSDTKTRTLTQPLALTLSLLSDKDISCFDGNDGEIRLTASGGASSYEYSSDGINWQAAPAFANLRAQSYTLRVRDVNSCVTPLNNTLTQPTQLAIAFTDIEPAYCSDPRGKARAVVSGGTGAYRYEWRNEANTVFDTDATIENLAPGIYTLTSLDANDCPVTNAIGIVSADGPQVAINSVVSPLCSYSSDGSALVTATGNGPFTYAWPNGQTSAQVTGVAQGAYIVSVRDVNNCLTTKTVDITAPDALSVALVKAENPACFGDANGGLTVSGSGGVGAYTYSWGTLSGAEITGLAKGSYTVVLTDANACTTQQTFSLDEPALLQVNMTHRTLPLCFDGQDGVLEATATGGNGQYNYVWSNGATSYRADALRAGNHSVTVTDAKGCSIAQTFSIGQPDSLQIRLLDNQSPDCHDGCNGELSVDAIGGTGTLQWLWNTNATTTGITNICAGEYEVTATDAHACTTTAVYTVINPDALELDLGGSATLCVGQTYVLDPGSGWVEYNWTSNTGLSSNAQSVTIQEAGEYRLEVKNALGCGASDIFLLETSRDLLKASFMIPKEAFVNDTIVMIDISWPLPQSIAWSFPGEMKKVLDLGDVVYGQFAQAGTYTVTLATQLGECRDVIGKSVTILSNGLQEQTDGLGFEELVRKFELFPNPSQGTFEVNVEMMKEEAVTLSIWNPVSARMVTKQATAAALSHITTFDLTDLGPGTYVIRLDHARGTKYIRFVVY